MEDFKLIINQIALFLSIEIPVFGYEFSLSSIFLATLILSMLIGFLAKIFGGD